MSENTPIGLQQDGYNAYGWVDGKWVPVVSTAMGNCWDQDDQRPFCAHIVKAVNYHERLERIAQRIVWDYEHWQNDEPGPDDIEDIVADARTILQELEGWL